MKKEIEKEIIKFDLKRLKGKKVVVNCRTKEQFGSFVNWANSLGVDFGKHNHWEKYKEDSCLMITLDLLWTYGNIELFEKEDYEIISYEEALLKESKEEPKEISEETSKQNSTQVVKQPKIKDELIFKVKTEKIGIRINSEEELSIWFNFLDKHSDKDLRRPERYYIKGYVYANDTCYNNIMEFNPDRGYYEEEGFTIYNFKDICEDSEEDIGTDFSKTKLSDFLKKNSCYEKFINNFNKKFNYSNWKIKIEGSLSRAFAWEATEEDSDYWYSIDDKWRKLTNKENDLINFFEEKPKQKEPTEPLNYLVQVKGKGIAKVKHSYESATKEAQRLCKKEAPTEVYVLEIKKYLNQKLL